MLWSGLFRGLDHWEGLWAESKVVMSHLVLVLLVWWCVSLRFPASQTAQGPGWLDNLPEYPQPSKRKDSEPTKVLKAKPEDKEVPVISRGIPSGQLSLQFGQPAVACRCTCLETHSDSASCAAPTQLPSIRS